MNYIPTYSKHSNKESILGTSYLLIIFFSMKKISLLRYIHHLIIQKYKKCIKYYNNNTWKILSERDHSVIKPSDLLKHKKKHYYFYFTKAKKKTHVDFFNLN